MRLSTMLKMFLCGQNSEKREPRAYSPARQVPITAAGEKKWPLGTVLTNYGSADKLRACHLATKTDP